ncbi:MAG: cytochrome C [Gammaproteobacteria bacterium HGW-Gammaproteobacteria-8]|nr:MAG: cytochrome C [Gammaproteobacteria bacterium HGW-Gammaproteobacteria-8]
MNPVKSITASLILIGLSLPVAAQDGDYRRGLEKSQVCQSCHGQTGNESLLPSYPRLAGQHQDYLAQALRSYRDGTRNNAVMAGFAAALSDQDIADLAAWYARQDGLRNLSID